MPIVNIPENIKVSLGGYLEKRKHYEEILKAHREAHHHLEELKKATMSLADEYSTQEAEIRTLLLKDAAKVVTGEHPRIEYILVRNIPSFQGGASNIVEIVAKYGAIETSLRYNPRTFGIVADSRPHLPTEVEDNIVTIRVFDNGLQKDKESALSLKRFAGTVWEISQAELARKSIDYESQPFEIKLEWERIKETYFAIFSKHFSANQD